MIEDAVLHQEMQNTVGQVWKTSLGKPLSAAHACDPALEDHCTIAGAVDIHGAWNGTLLVSMSESLINSLTKDLFHLESALDHRELREDLLKEIANLIGGNIKSYLPEPCRLDLPRIINETTGRWAPEDAQKAIRLCFTSEHEPVMVTMYRRA